MSYTVSVVARNHVGDSAVSGSASLTTNPDVADVHRRGRDRTDIRSSHRGLRPVAGGRGVDRVPSLANGGTSVVSGRQARRSPFRANGTSYTFTALRLCRRHSAAVEFGQSAQGTAFDPVGSAVARQSDASQHRRPVQLGSTSDNGRGPMQIAVSDRWGRLVGLGRQRDRSSGGNACAHRTPSMCRDGQRRTEGTGRAASGSSASCPPPPAITRSNAGDATGHLGSTPNSVTLPGPTLPVHRRPSDQLPAGAGALHRSSASAATARTTDGNGQAYFNWGWYSGRPRRRNGPRCTGGGVTASSG